MLMGARPQLAGRIRFISLGDLFQVLGGNNCTGTLTLRRQNPEMEGRILFSEGNPVDATAGPLAGLEAVYALFGWRDGCFEFRSERVNARRVIRNGRMEIVLDALRMLDDGVIAKLGPAGSLHRETPEEIPLIRGPFVDYGYIVQEETIPVGRRIVTEGAHGNWIWVILEGRALISRETPEGLVPVAHLGPGAFVGTFAALLFGEYVRTATVTATTEVQLALLDTYRLSGEFASLSGELRRWLLHLSGRLREVTDEFLARCAAKPTSFSFPAAADGREEFPMDTMEEEYGRLSRTFKNLIQYLGTGIRLTAGRCARGASGDAPSR
jgi:CRP-like cAMP-binding protein